MKIREKLNKDRNKIFLLGFISWVLFAAGIIFSGTQKDNSFPILIYQKK
jgi:hypothetical protein